MIDETAGVAGLAAGVAQRILERRQWAHESDKLDRCAVDRDGDMYPREPRPAQDEHSAEDDEEHEREVKDEHDVGGGSKIHR